MEDNKIKEHLDVLEFNNKKFLILGTAHVSKQSVEEVEFIINQEEPDCICVELDKARYDSIQNSQSYSNVDIFKILKEKKALFVLVNLILSSYQKKIGKELDIKPGMEMIKAITIAEEKNITIELCDRSVQATLMRTWRKSGFFSKINLLTAMLATNLSKEKIDVKDLEKLKERNELEKLLEELGKELPKAKEILIDERDKFLAKKIYMSNGEKIFAVVGAGHKKGIIEHIKKLENKEIEIDLEELETIPEKSFVSKALPYLISLFFIALIAWGFLKGDYQRGTENAIKWILINGSLSMIGAILALAHPLVIIASFFVAPLTSLNPTIGAGIVCGFLQAFIVKPKLLDLENLSDSALSLKGFYKNKFLKVILVFFFTSIGSAIASMIAIPFLLN